MSDMNWPEARIVTRVELTSITVSFIGPGLPMASITAKLHPLNNYVPQPQQIVINAPMSMKLEEAFKELLNDMAIEVLLNKSDNQGGGA